MDVTIREDGKGQYVQSVDVNLDADAADGSKFVNLPPIDDTCLEKAAVLPIDNFVRRVNRLCNIVKAYGATGKMIQMGVQLGGAGVGKLVSFFPALFICFDFGIHFFSQCKSLILCRIMTCI